MLTPKADPDPDKKKRLIKRITNQSKSMKSILIAPKILENGKKYDYNSNHTSCNSPSNSA